MLCIEIITCVAGVVGAIAGIVGAAAGVFCAVKARKINETAKQIKENVDKNDATDFVETLIGYDDFLVTLVGWVDNGAREDHLKRLLSRSEDLISTINRNRLRFSDMANTGNKELKILLKNMVSDIGNYYDDENRNPEEGLKTILGRYITDIHDKIEDIIQGIRDSVIK